MKGRFFGFALEPAYGESWASGEKGRGVEDFTKQDGSGPCGHRVPARARDRGACERAPKGLPVRGAGHELVACGDSFFFFLLVRSSQGSTLAVPGLWKKARISNKRIQCQRAL